MIKWMVVGLALAMAVGAAPPVGAGEAAPPLAQAEPPPCTGPDCPPAADAAGGAAAPERPAPKPRTLAAYAADKDRLDGLFPLYRDRISGGLAMEIAPDQLNRDFIYYSFVRSGTSGLMAQLGGLRFAGQIGDNMVIRFERRFNRVLVMRQNVGTVVDPASPLARVRDVNQASGVLATLNVVAVDYASGRIVVGLTPLVTGTDLLRIGIANPLLATLGAAPTLSRAKTSLVDARAYPANIAVTAEYVFDLRSAAAPISVQLQHNFVAMPPSGYTERADDPRVGLFSVQRTDIARVDGLPFADSIRRWRLEKADPAAAVSAPVRPITFWIHNATPLEYRDIVRRAVLQWNDAFAEAGFTGAVQVEQQPDDADWDAGDIRYNLIQWVASPQPLFNGYGPSVVDPRTGEIVAAHIVVEHGGLRRQYDLAALAPAPTAAAGQGNHDHDHDRHGGHAHDADGNCLLADHLRGALGLALAALDAGVVAGDADAEAWAKRLIEERLTYLIVHEVGHTLGLSHNFKASHFRSLDELKTLPADAAISGSVMDYPATNLLPGRSAATPIFPTRLGPYDFWAIRFAYDPALGDPAAMQAHLARAGAAGLLFGNDAESMAGRGIDPRTMPFDQSSDPLGFADAQLTLIADLRAALPGALFARGRSASDFVAVHLAALGIMRQHFATIARHVGGVMVDRDMGALTGPSGGPLAPLRPVSGAEQRRAMAMLAARLFAPDAMPLSPAYIANLVPQRRGQSGIRLPDVHDEMWQLQKVALDHLLRAETLARLVNSGPLGGEYDVDKALDDLVRAIFAADANGSATSQRRNLQTRFTQQLIALYKVRGPAADLLRPHLLAQLQAVDGLARRGAGRGDPATRAARAYIRQQIADTLVR